MDAVMDGEATSAQLAGLLVGLHVRGESVDELTGFAEAMRERVLSVVAPPGTIDACGTGGDTSQTFNISTAAALVVAASGVPVAKHGNRAVTSRSGSSDVLDALGVTVDQPPEEAQASLEQESFAFLFAPRYHPAMRHAAPTRRELGVRTCFNLIGPLTNPAGVVRQVVGVSDPAIAPRIAEVLLALGVERALVVHGDRIDELPLDGSGVRYDVRSGSVTRRTVSPEEAGLEPAPTERLGGGTPAENARSVEAILQGRRGPERDVVLLNAAAALEVAGRADSLRDGAAQAAETIDSGAAADLLARLRRRRSRLEAGDRKAERRTSRTPTAGTVR